MNRHNSQIIPASQLISIGYTEDDAQKMEKLQNDMKKYCDEDDTTNVDLTGVDNPGQFFHDSSWMIPHWIELFNALHGRTSVEEIQISGIKLPVSILDTIFPTLQSMHLNCLGLCVTRIGNDGFNQLSSFLKENTSLKYLTISGDRINDLSVASSLSDALSNHPSLEQIGLVQCLGYTDILGKLLEGCKTIKKRLRYFHTISNPRLSLSYRTLYTVTILLKKCL